MIFTASFEIFYHPDFTVGHGITPCQSFYWIRGLLPPVGNFTPPRRFTKLSSLFFLRLLKIYD